MEEIPLLKVPNQQVLVVLNGQYCTINVYQRKKRVYLDLALNDEILRQGAICLPGLDILGSPYPFEGFLFWTDELTEPDMQQPPEYTQFGDRFHLYYITLDEASQYW